MKNIVTFSGAGLSKESGIPTFRDSKDGLWHNHKVEEVADHDAWYTKKNMSIMLEFYEHRWQNVQSVEPNAAHKAIARLQEKFNVINITQNVDNLLERAGCQDVWHLHGTLGRRKCERHKDITNLDGDTHYQCDYKVEHAAPVKLGELCPKCGSQLRPDVVWFGEAVDIKDSYLESLAKVCDVFIAVGTSAQVHPAAGLLFTFRGAEQKFFIDPNPPLRLHSFTKLAGTACEHMPKVAADLLGQ
jgi:NAD-dependent deacetylase